MLSFRSLAAALILSLFATDPIRAATFELGGDETLNCVMTISGIIEEGDADRFRDFLWSLYRNRTSESEIPYFSEYGESRVCLDSPGGSIQEAIEIADTMVFGYRVSYRSSYYQQSPAFTVFVRSLGTAISSGSVCESACALIFMAGGYFDSITATMNLREVDRVLHVNGVLGFHAPSLEVPSGIYSEEIINRAFSLAVDAVDAIASRTRWYRIPVSLFEIIVSTPPTEIFYLSNVEQAASWAIELAGFALIDAPSSGNLARMCENTTALSRVGFSQEDWYTNTAPEEIRLDSGSFWGSARNPIGTESQTYLEPESIVLLWGPELFDQNGAALSIENSSCSAVYFPTTGNSIIGNFSLASGEGGVVTRFASMQPFDHGLNLFGSYGYALFPGYLTLSDLSMLANQFPRGRVPPNTLLPPLVDQLSGYCAYYDTRGDLIDSQPCVAEHQSRQRADRRAHRDWLVMTWWDGTSLSVDLDTEIGAVDGNWERLGGLNGAFQYPEDRPRVFAPPLVLETDERAPEHEGCFRHVLRDDVRCFTFDTVVWSSASPFRR